MYVAEVSDNEVNSMRKYAVDFLELDELQDWLTIFTLPECPDCEHLGRHACIPKYYLDTIK